MKFIFNILIILIMASSPLLAAGQVEAGPRKGRILQFESVKAEFFVEKDRTVSIAFYDSAKKQVSPEGQVVALVAEAPSGKVKLTFERKGDLLVSTSPLPEGEGYNVVVQAKESAEAKPKNFRIKLELYECEGCQNPEYACTCDE